MSAAGAGGGRRPAFDPVADPAVADAPGCPACGAPMLAWQPQLRCVLWRCPRCGCLRRDPALAPAAARAVEYGGDPSGDAVRTALTWARLRRACGPALRGRVLEVGSGAGRLAARIAGVAAQTVALDPHPAPVPGARVVAGTLDDAGLPAGSFDLVVAVHVLEHLDVPAALRRVAALLRPGGVLYAVTPSADTALLRLAGSAWWMLEDPTHVQFVSRAGAARMLAGAGFDRARVRPLVADSLAVEAATAARWAARRRAVRAGEPGGGELGGPPAGVLPRRGVQAAALAGLPATLALRAAAPSWRPVLELVARRGPS